LKISTIGLAACAVGLSAADTQNPPPISNKKVPIIDITDLYHPPQDPGDNFDLIAAFALPEIDLRAVILDATQRYRQPVAEHPDPNFRDPTGPRDPGIIPVSQLNYIFGRNVPFGVGPFSEMKSPGDKKLDAPGFQQTGADLILQTLRQSREKVEILSFGSARPLAVAYNREPGLLRSKVRLIHLSAGASSPDYLEWNVMLDPQAIVCLLRSHLPIALYPCATKDGPFAYGPHNCFWRLPDLRFIQRMDARLRRYSAYAFERMARSDFLRAMDEDFPEEVMERVYARPHNVWETSVWMRAANRRLVRRADGHYRIIPAGQVKDSDTVLPNDLKPCQVEVRDDGHYRFSLTSKPANFLVYDRGDPYENEKALREALPALYESFRGSSYESKKEPLWLKPGTK